MSESDSFLDEVREEVRRDRLYGYVRKYGWIAVTVVIVAVGTTAFFEYREVVSRQASEERGERILLALEAGDEANRAKALSDLIADGGPARAIIGLRSAAEYVAAGQVDQAVGILEMLADDSEIGSLYRDLAAFKVLILKGNLLEANDRLSALDRFARPGSPFRPLALEQRAVVHIERGEREKALTELVALLDEPGVTDALRSRVRRGIVALGGEVDGLVF
ncbi:MAG: hypothetical protein OXI81_18450 [Paracoccaceae bacterium]|nr:hypothetical protein [Paracoccaceae bacterium]MDE2913201.1 hypothetical protein [Paracoccaceae bacterium]